MYQVEITSAARRQIKKLPPNIKPQILQALEDLAIEPRPYGVLKMQSEDGLYRIRVEDYRIVYAIEDDELLVLVVKVGHRRDVYQ